MYLSCWLLGGCLSESRAGHTLSYSLADRGQHFEDMAPSLMAYGRGYFLMAIVRYDDDLAFGLHWWKWLDDNDGC